MQTRRSSSARSAYFFVSVTLVLLLVFLVLGSANLRDIQRTISDYDSLVHAWFDYRIAAMNRSLLSSDDATRTERYEDLERQMNEVGSSEPIAAAATLSDELRLAIEDVSSQWRLLQNRVRRPPGLQGTEEVVVRFEDSLVESQAMLRGFVQTQDRSFSVLLYCLGATIVLIIVVFVAVEREGQRARRAAFRTRLLAQTTIAAQESERARISRALHDSLAQELSLARLEASQLLVRETSIADGQTRVADQLSGRIGRAIEWVRDLAYELRPAEIDSLGLLAAMRDYCSERASETGLELNWSISGEDGHINSEKAIGIYRIAQEAITNALRHSGGRHVVVHVVSGRSALELSVADDGRGIADGGVRQRTERGLGITGMEERARMMGARLELGSNHNRGTTVRLLVPLGETGKQGEQR